MPELKGRPYVETPAASPQSSASELVVRNGTGNVASPPPGVERLDVIQYEERVEAPPSRARHRDTLRELQKRYKVDVRPRTCQFRVTKTLTCGGTLEGYKMSMDVLRHRNHNPYVAFEMKPGGDPWIKKVTLTPALHHFHVFTPALEIGCLRLNVAVGYNWERRALCGSWRVKTKWTRNSKIHRRVEVFKKEKCEMTTHWNVKQELPQMGGEITRGESRVKSDIGKFQLDLSRLKFVLRI
ncbi:hypothetical protein BSKO_03896 [Bryopsis sp. KO-2023]|nr:hypothetical protein BSKO_03896 [Bryopsis sp. KO-2023]